MSWLRVDDGFVENDKVSGLSDRSFRLHVAALCYCARNLTDGRLDERAVRVVSALVTPQRTTRNVTELVDAGLWLVKADTYEIKDYLEYNPTAEHVKATRESNAARQARQRALRNADSNAVTNGATHGVSNRTPSPPLNSKAFPGRLKCPHCTVQVKSKAALEEHLHVSHDVELPA